MALKNRLQGQVIHASNNSPGHVANSLKDKMHKGILKYMFNKLHLQNWRLTPHVDAASSVAPPVPGRYWDSGSLLSLNGSIETPLHMARTSAEWTWVYSNTEQAIPLNLPFKAGKLLVPGLFPLTQKAALRDPEPMAVNRDDVSVCAHKFSEGCLPHCLACLHLPTAI